MYKIQTLNKISPKGLDRLPRDAYETASEILNPDAILVRSQKMHDMPIPDTVKAIARAGAGVNNIPVDACTGRGIVVFNTPGANANGVKELVLAGLFLSSRNVVGGITWAKSIAQKGDEVPKLIEKEKSAFAGPEIKGKKLGVVGLGAIGVMVANDAVSLGMEVVGYDPYISVEAAWGLSRTVARATSLDRLLIESDYVTLHLPLNDSTKGMLAYEKLSLMKKGARLLNFARGGLVNNKDLIRAISEGIISAYVTDFPDDELLKTEKVICLPHLGASTPESEDNCAIMAVDQVRDYLENGNIKNSVNFPNCEMGRIGRAYRLTVANKNIPNMVGQMTALLAEEKINISDLINKHRDDVAYNIIDTDSKLSPELLNRIRKIDGVIMVREV
jgi:D-3-phosphoglycerate dehydrogenase